MTKIAALLILLIANIAAASPLQVQLEDIHNRWFVAFDRGDGAEMDKLEAPDLVLVLPDGHEWHKSAPRTGKQKPSGDGGHRLTNAFLRQYGDTAILTGQVAAEGKPTELTATTVVFVRQGGQWLIASAQWSPVGK